MLTDSYKKIHEGVISLSGESVGAEGVTKDTIASLKGGDAIVEFKPIDDAAKKLVEEMLEQEFVDNDEGFIIHITDKVTIYADSDRAKLFAACSVKDKYIDGKINKGIWWSYPAVKHRSLRIFLPPKGEIDYFYKLMDQIVHLGYNSILLEICGALEFKRHPEINKAWLEYCASVHSDPQKYRYVGRGYYRLKNSVHTFNAGGQVYSQEEMKELAQYCRDRFIEIIPEVPSLSHSEYICIAHPELRECADEPYAATACPSNPDLNKLVFDLYDEVLEVFDCKAIHIGHDEWWTMCVCDKCKDKDPIDLYVNNVLESYNYLKSKGIKTYMWGEKLVSTKSKNGEVHCAAEKVIYTVPTKGDVKSIEVMGQEIPIYDRYWFNAPDWVKEEGFKQVIRSLEGCSSKLPPDIVYINWAWHSDTEFADNVFYREGKEMILGNTCPSILNNYKLRYKYGTSGFSVSNWAETTQYGMQDYSTPFQLGYGSIISWNHERTEYNHKKNVFDTVNGLYNLHNREVLENDHIEIVHTVVKDFPDGRVSYASMAAPKLHLMNLGHYLITYKDGSTHEEPVYFSLNISASDIWYERIISGGTFAYSMDGDISHPSPVCDFIEEGDKTWYKTVIPAKGEIEKWEFIPREDLEGYVETKALKLIKK